MRKALAASFTVSILLAGAAPAVAEPASSSSASAYGASATGLLPISPTITAAAQQPPDQDSPVASLLTVPLGGLALSGTVGVQATAHRADDIPALLAAVPVSPLISDPTTQLANSARGFAKTEGVGLVFNAPAGIDPVLALLSEVSTAAGGLLGADAVSAEAVARCVNNQPVFETGFQVVGLGGLVGDTIDPLVQPLLDLLLPLLGPDAPLSAVISVATGVVTPLPDGVAIDGLVISVPLLDQVIRVSHAEAHMPANCSVAPPPAPQPTGPGPIASLAATGGDHPYLPLGIMMLAAVVVLRRINRRPERNSIG